MSKKISTHAPAGGATNATAHQPHQLLGFLLTPLREGRLGELANAYKYLRISTHAPAGGATVQADRLQQQPDYFYSRPCGRGDYAGP